MWLILCDGKIRRCCLYNGCRMHIFWPLFPQIPKQIKRNRGNFKKVIIPHNISGCHHSQSRKAFRHQTSTCPFRAGAASLDGIKTSLPGPSGEQILKKRLRISYRHSCPTIASLFDIYLSSNNFFFVFVKE